MTTIKSTWTKPTKDKEVYLSVVWESRILGYWKCVFTSNLRDGKLYEVTYSLGSYDYTIEVHERKHIVVLPP